MSIAIEALRLDDLDDVLELLTASQLPLDGLRDHLATTLVARHDGRVVGSATLEIYPDGALLRSVAVAPAVQNQRLGRRLTEAAIRLAGERAMPAIYLLTTTADGYFPKFGFERIARSDVPASVQTSIEFTSACPSTATVMRKPL
jgi:amino-acid N-acetyltransferase